MNAIFPVIVFGSLLLAAAIAIAQHALMECSRGRLEELAEKSKNPSLPARVAAILGDLPGHHAAIGLWRVGATFAFVIAGVGWSVHLVPLAEDQSGVLGASPGAAAICSSV